MTSLISFSSFAIHPGRRHLRQWLTSWVMSLSLLGGAGVAQAQDTPLKFKWGAPTADYFTLYVAIDQGLFKQENLDPQFFWFPTGAPLLAGLKSGDIDVFTTGLATVFALGQKIPLTFIGWEVDTAAAEGLVTNNDAIKDYRDIAQAKKIAAAPGTCAQVALGLLARKAGVPYKSLNIVNVAPPLYGNAFKSGSIDAGLAWAPYPQVLVEQGYRVASWDEDYAPDGGVCPSLYGARPQFLKEHPEVGDKLVRIRAKALALIEGNPQLAIDALARRLSISTDAARAVYERASGNHLPTLQQEVTPGSRWSLVDPEAGLARKLHIAGEVLHEAGSIPAPLSWEQIRESIDPSYIQRYLQQGQQ